MKKRLFEKYFPFFLAVLFGLGVYYYGSETSQPIQVKNKLTVSFLDVGQGDSTLIKTASGKLILIDGGPDEKIKERLSKETGPFSNEIEAVVVTHPHADHIAGLNSIFDYYKIKKIYLSGYEHSSPDYFELLSKIKKYNIPAEEISAGKKVDFDEVQIEFYWPPTDSNKTFEDLNNTSAVFTLTANGVKILFLGDLSAEYQDKLNLPEPTKVQIMKVAHHGSKNAVSEGLTEKLRPDLAVISVGADNNFGHPAGITLEKLNKIIILRTDMLGTVRFFLSDTNFIHF